MGGNVEVQGIVTGDDQIYRFTKLAREYVNSSSLPFRIATNADGSENRQALVEGLRKVFVSDAAIEGDKVAML